MSLKDNINISEFIERNLNLKKKKTFKELYRVCREEGSLDVQNGARADRGGWSYGVSFEYLSVYLSLTRTDHYLLCIMYAACQFMSSRNYEKCSPLPGMTAKFTQMYM